MKHLTPFPKILNEIFSDLMTESHITINYKGFPCASDDEDDVRDIRILSVNNFKNPKEYRARIQSLCSTLLNDLMRAQETFEPAEKAFFMEQALEKFEPLLHVVTYEQFHPRFRREDQDEILGLHLFSHPDFTGDKYHEAPFYLFDRILCRSAKFSYIWYDAITEIYEKLGTLATLIEHIPYPKHQPQPTNPKKYKEKLRFRGSVPQLACFARILEENLFFNNSNDSEICRVFIGIFETKGQDDISWKSFKNNFDSPPLDAILFWQEECRKLMQYFQILINKYAA